MLINELQKHNFNSEQILVLNIINELYINKNIYIKNKNVDNKTLSDILIRSGITLPVFDKLECPELTKLLDKYVKYKKLNNISLFKELKKITGILRKNNIEHACFKGPVISRLAYGDIKKREFTDLDIFISRNDYQKAKCLLLSSDYESYFKLEDSLENKFIGSQNSSNFIKSSSKLNIDLHFATERNNLSFTFSFEDLKNRIIEVDIDGAKFQTFDIETTIILLILHGSKHGWTKLYWILDLALLTNKHTIDWDYILNTSMQNNFLTMLLWYCRISEIIFCTSHSKEIDHLLTGNSNINTMALETIKNSLETKTSYNNYLYYKSMNKNSDRMQKIVYNFYPTPAEFAYRIPSNFYFLYYLLRICRLSYKVASKMIKS